MFGGKLQLRVRSKKWRVRLGNKKTVRSEEGWVQYLIGRGENAYLRSEAPGLADEHCWIAWDGMQAKVIPCPGKLVQVNGRSIEGEQLLIAGDVLKLGELVLRLAVPEDSGDGASQTAVRSQQQTTADVHFERALEEALFGQAGRSSEQRDDGRDRRGEQKVRSTEAASKNPSAKSVPPAATPKTQDSTRAADQALSKLFEQRLAQQKRVKPRPPGASD